MQTEFTDHIQIINTTMSDLGTVHLLFDQAIELQGKNGYKVWEGIDNNGLEKDIMEALQYKIVKGKDVLCIFSILYNDPFIWGDRDKGDALYLHRIVVNPNFKGQKQFQKVLDWAKEHAKQNNLKFLRMDTWADNKKIIDYYQSFGFEFIENLTTPDTPELPIQNRNLNVALLELKL